jgi:serine/threonine protein kinase
MKTHRSHPSKESIKAFAEGRLGGAKWSQIEEHLLNCDTCCDHLAGNNDDDGLIQLARIANAIETNPLVSHDPTSIPLALKNHPRYHVIESIAVGAMGVVYRAEHLLMQRTVALKVIHPSFLSNSQAIRRFHQEVRIAAQLNHPNIVASHDAEQAGELHFLVMEYVDGMTLAQYVQRNGPATVAQAFDWIRQAASALDHAHQLGLTHRDIKPANLMITTNGTLKILDFGLSRLDSATWIATGNLRVEKSSATLPDMFLGTPGYVSPEQIANASQADIRSDIYSLGCTLYFLLTGRSPFTRDSVVQTLHAQQTEALPEVSKLRKNIPQKLVDILNRMTAKDPEDRIATPGELLLALQEVEIKSDHAGTSSRVESTQDTHRSFLTHVALEETPKYSVSATKRMTNQRRRKLISIGSAILTAILVSGILLSSIANPWQSTPKANLLVLMPSNGLSYDDYYSLVEAAESANVKLDFASSKPGVAKWYEGYGIGTVSASLVVGPDLKTVQYDGIVFLGCDTNEFLPGSFVGRQVNRIVYEFYQHEKLLIAVGAGQRVLGKHGLLKGVRIAKCPPLHTEQVRFAGAILTENALEQDGNIITASMTRDATKLVERILSVLKK